MQGILQYICRFFTLFNAIEQVNWVCWTALVHVCPLGTDQLGLGEMSDENETKF